MSDDKFDYSKKDQRKVSNFIGQELLYDYVANKLDAERTTSVEEYVKSSRDAQADVQKINNALNYLEHLSETVVADSLVQEIKQPSSYLDLLLKQSRVDEWPKALKMGLELLVVSIGVIAIILVIPWHKVMEINFSKNKEIVLLEVEKAKTQSMNEIPATEIADAETTFPDEGIKGAEAKPSTQKAAETKLAEVKAPEIKIPEVKLPEAKVPEAKAPDIIVPATKPTETVAAKAAEKTNKNEKRQGFLYRGEIHVANLPVTTKKFVDYITELGGRKAGEVPIGWTKGNSTYFHFTMPDAKYTNLQEFLKGYGQLKIQKENHDRVMPEGIVRIIISVYEK